MTQKYGNNTNGNAWMRDFNTQYTIDVGDITFPTIEYYLQYKRYIYIMGISNATLALSALKKTKTYFKMLDAINTKNNPAYIDTGMLDENTLQEVYNNLYHDYIYARFLKAQQYPVIKKNLMNMYKDTKVNPNPQEFLYCDFEEHSPSKDKLKISLMHITCVSKEFKTRGNQDDPWAIVYNMFTVDHKDDLQKKKEEN